MRQSKYTVSVIIAGVLWGVVSIFVKHLNAGNLTPLQILFLRAIISSAIIFLFLFFINRQLLVIKLKDIWMFIGTGVISLTFFSMCYFSTILEIGASVAVILLYTSPIFVLIMSLLIFHEKITLPKFVALVMTFAGCILVSGILAGDGSISIRGFIVGLGAGFGYALYSIFSRFALRKYNPLTVTFYTFCFSGLSLIPFCKIPQIMTTLQPSIIFWAVGIAFFCSVLPYIFYTYGLVGLETGKAAIFVTIEPLVGTLVGICLYGEAVTPAKIIGILLTFSAVILLGLKK